MKQTQEQSLLSVIKNGDKESAVILIDKIIGIINKSEKNAATPQLHVLDDDGRSFIDWILLSHFDKQEDKIALIHQLVDYLKSKHDSVIFSKSVFSEIIKQKLDDLLPYLHTVYFNDLDKVHSSNFKIFIKDNFIDLLAIAITSDNPVATTWLLNKCTLPSKIENVICYQPEMIKLFRENLANLLKKAIEVGSVTCLQLLFDEINKSFKDIYSDIFKAEVTLEAYRQRQSILLKIFNKQFNGGCTLLHIAFGLGNTEVIAKLFEAGALFFITNNDGKLPIDYVALLDDKKAHETIKYCMRNSYLMGQSINRDIAERIRAIISQATSDEKFFLIGMTEDKKPFRPSILDANEESENVIVSLTQALRVLATIGNAAEANAKIKSVVLHYCRKTMLEKKLSPEETREFNQVFNQIGTLQDLTMLCVAQIILNRGDSLPSFEVIFKKDNNGMYNCDGGIIQCLCEDDSSKNTAETQASDSIAGMQESEKEKAEIHRFIGKVDSLIERLNKKDIYRRNIPLIVTPIALSLPLAGLIIYLGSLLNENVDNIIELNQDYAANSCSKPESNDVCQRIIDSRESYLHEGKLIILGLVSSLFLAVFFVVAAFLLKRQLPPHFSYRLNKLSEHERLTLQVDLAEIKLWVENTAQLVNDPQYTQDFLHVENFGRLKIIIARLTEGIDNFKIQESLAEFINLKKLLLSIVTGINQKGQIGFSSFSGDNTVVLQMGEEEEEGKEDNLIPRPSGAHRERYWSRLNLFRRQPFNDSNEEVRLLITPTARSRNVV